MSLTAAVVEGVVAGVVEGSLGVEADSSREKLSFSSKS
jgi:hypothetical protein